MTIEVIQPGIQTTVQDWPGRVGLLSLGYFPGGPMDDLAFRLANTAVGNEPSAAALEITLGRFKVRFLEAATVAITGASGEITLNGTNVDMWKPIQVPEGAELKIAAAETGFRFYLAVRGGVDVPEVLGSRATYTMGSLGGLNGRALKKGDLLQVGTAEDGTPVEIPDALIPIYSQDWELEVVPGPHATADFVTAHDVEMFFSNEWAVGQSANRTGIRLDPMKLQWSRPHGGIAGGHPSNILDSGYPLGGINLNGDTPVIIGPDGPASGGFVVFGVVPSASLWKLGQMRPGRDTLKFKPVSVEDAYALSEDQQYALTAFRSMK
jgi:biotin-dependent carboxylase-like uncharacterized protein